MNFFFEDPWKFVIIGLIVEIGLLVMLFRSGRGLWLYWMLGLMLATTALIVIERCVVTDREQVEIELYNVATVLETNDVEGVLSFFSPNAKETRGLVQAQMPRFKVESVSIKNDLKIIVNDLTSPPSARAEFHVVITGGTARGDLHGLSLPLSFAVLYERVGGRWLISSYDDHGALHGM